MQTFEVIRYVIVEKFLNVSEPQSLPKIGIMMAHLIELLARLKEMYVRVRHIVGPLFIPFLSSSLLLKGCMWF